MIPTLYDKTGAVKIGDLNDCIECLVEEERNGIFELTMVYPANSSILESIVYDNIIVADANDYLKSQKFRVYNTRKLMANRIEVCARHISFDLVHDWVDVISIENQSCEYALNIIFRNSQFSKHFKGHSDIVNAQNFKVNKVTCLEAIGGTDGSIIDTYGTGAEILRDNTDIHVLNRRGRDNDVVIEYRKNLTGLEVEEDTTDLVTRIMPYAIYTNSNNEEIEVRGDFIDSPLINNYAHPYVKYMDYSEKFEDDEVPTKTKLNNLAAKEYINNKVDIPKNNYKIEFIPLSKCAGYEGLEDRINLCDVVTIKDSRYNIDTQAKVIKVIFDVLRGRYDSMELGEPRTTLGDIIGGTGDGPTQGPPGPPGPQGPAGADGSIGDFPETLPEVPNITAKVYGFANIELSWTFENKVYYSYELYASKTKGFVPNTFNLIFSGQASTYLYQAEPNETWYFRACALNTHGQRTEFSEEVEVSTVKISDLSNYVSNAAIDDALIGTLSLDRGWFGELRGNYIDARQLSVTDGNGKRTLDIDSFGNVNLDVASLKIKANSVATESFVSSKKNEAINSANNTLNTTIANYYTKTQTDSRINIAENSITQSVANTYETKTDATNKINGINTSISNLTQRMSTAESKITDTAITDVVKQNFYTKTETDGQITSKGYQTASQVQQTVDSLQLKFTQSGGYNLIRNSKPEKNANLWISDSGISTTVNSADNCLTTTGWGKCFRLATTNSSPGGARSQRFDLAPNTKYTVSGWVYSDSASNGAAVYLRTSNSLDAASNPTSSSYDGDVTILQTGAQASYKFFQKTITTGATVKSAFIKIVHRGSQTSGTSTLVAFNQLQIVEGEFALPWSPHPNEVYDGVTEIDKDGVRVSTNRGAYTQFGAEGMDSYDNQGNQTLGLRNGGLTFYASNNHEYVGYISQSFVDTQERNGVVIGLTHYGDYLALGTSEDVDPNQGFYRPSWILLSRYEDKVENVNYGINMYQDLYMHDYSLRNSQIKYDGFKRNKNDYISFYTINSTSSSELNLELADDSSTYFNILANNYNDGSKYIARFNYAKGTTASNVGIHFYRALNCHGYNITNVGNMSVYTLAAEDLAVNDIRVAAPYALCALDDKEQTTLSVVKSVDDVIEANGVATVTNGRAEVTLPDGLAFTDYYVHVTPNKVAAVAVTERGDSSFVIETNSEEEIEVFYTIKAFQPQRVAREAIYGELQGEDGTNTATYEEEIK